MRPELGWCLWLFLAGCGAPEPPRAPTVPDSEIEPQPQPLRIVPLPPGIEPLISLVPDPPRRPAPSASSALPPSPPPPATLPGLSASAVAALATTVETFYQRAIPLDCDFSIEAFEHARNTRTTRQAHVVIAGPGEFLATLSSGSVVAAHASTLATYDPIAHQWFSTAVAADFVPIALCYAGGPGSLTNHLTLAGYPGSVMNAHGLDLLAGSPNRPVAKLTKVVLYAPPSGEVTRTVLLTPRGDRESWDQVRCAAARPTPLPAPSNVLPLTAATAKLLDEVASLTTALP
jgi:hypothetical protein